VSRAGLGSELLAVIARLVDERVEARLAELGITTTGATTEYSTTALPAGVSARTFATWSRTRVIGAVRDGRGWRCPRDAWERARSTPPRRGQGPDGRFTAGNDHEVDPDSLLRAAGLRPSKTDRGEP
jgi:hypothetical protein